MSLLPDPAELLAVADRIAGHAAAARSQASRLGAAVATAHWHGVAADAFHVQAFGVVAGLRSAAARLDDAADALRRHARRVAETLADIHRLADGLEHVPGHALRTVTGAVTDPGQVVSDVTSLAGDAASVLGNTLDLLGI